MNQKDSGWLFTHRHMSGPNVYDRVFQPRLNLVNTADTGNVTTPLFPSISRNDPIFQERAYVLGDSLNVASYSSFEVNKTFRMEPYRYGGILEPLIGLRYSSFKDYSVNQRYQTSNALITDPGTVAATDIVEILTTREWTIRNEMFGGQLGFRYFNHVGRWTLSSELRAMTMVNFRRERQNTHIITTEYGGTGANAAVVAEQTTPFPNVVIPRNTTSFAVPGFEVRAEAAYQLTKYIDVRGGVDFINLASNIRRAKVAPDRHCYPAMLATTVYK